jgi:hypothetical protein
VLPADIVRRGEQMPERRASQDPAAAGGIAHLERQI